MTVEDAAKQLEVSPDTIYHLCREGLIGHMRIGVGRGTIRLEQSDVDGYKETARAKAREGKPAPYVLKHIKPRR